MFFCPYCSMFSTIMFSIVTPDSGSTISLTICYEQSGQHNIVNSWFYQHRKSDNRLSGRMLPLQAVEPNAWDQKKKYAMYNT